MTGRKQLWYLTKTCCDTWQKETGHSRIWYYSLFIWSMVKQILSRSLFVSWPDTSSITGITFILKRLRIRINPVVLVIWISVWELCILNGTPEVVPSQVCIQQKWLWLSNMAFEWKFMNKFLVTCKNRRFLNKAGLAS